MRIFSCLIIVLFLSNDHAYEFRYHDYSEMTDFLRNIQSRYPANSALYEIGKSQGGK